MGTRALDLFNLTAEDFISAEECHYVEPDRPFVELAHSLIYTSPTLERGEIRLNERQPINVPGIFIATGIQLSIPTPKSTPSPIAYVRFQWPNGRYTSNVRVDHTKVYAPYQNVEPGDPTPTWTANSMNPSQALDKFAGTTVISNVLGFQVGSKLYYVVEAAVGSNAGGQNTFNVFIQESTNGGTTWNTVYNGPLGSFGHAAVLVGTTIYIFCDNANAINNDLWLFRFDTTTNSMVDAGTDFGPVKIGTNRGITASAFNDGKILVSFLDQTLGTSFQIAGVLYTPGSNTISARFDLGPVGSDFYIEWQITDPVTDIAMVGIASQNLNSIGNPGSGWGLQVIAVQESLTVSPPVLGISFTPLSSGGTPQFFEMAGTPTINNGQIEIIYNSHAAGGFPPASVAVVRSAISSSLSFNWAMPDILQTFSTLNPVLWSFDGGAGYSYALAVDGNGTLYAFYTVNTSVNDNSGSQTSIWFQTSASPGVWTSPTILFTALTPSSGLSIYPITLANGSIGIWATYVNPVLYAGPNPNDQYNSLSVVFFSPNGSPPPPPSAMKPAYQAPRPIRIEPVVCIPGTEIVIEIENRASLNQGPLAVMIEFRGRLRRFLKQ